MKRGPSKGRVCLPDTGIPPQTCSIIFIVSFYFFPSFFLALFDRNAGDFCPGQPFFSSFFYSSLTHFISSYRYIKELADRLNTLENSISTGDMHSYNTVVPMDGDMSPGPSESTSPPPPISGSGPPPSKSRKRTLSSSSEFSVNMHPGMHLQPLNQQTPHQRGERLPPIDSFHSHHGQVAPPQRQLPPPHAGPPPHQVRPHTPVSVSSGPDVPPSYRSTQSPSVTTANPYWKSDVPDYGRQATVHMPLDPVDVPQHAAKSASTDTPFEWDEASVDQ